MLKNYILKTQNVYALPSYYFSSIWSKVPNAPNDPIFDLVDDFQNDVVKKKVNLSVGAYRDDKGYPKILSSVLKASELYVQNKINHEYLPIAGFTPFIENSIKMAYRSCPVLRQKKIAAVQTISGSGALKLGMDFINQFYTEKNLNKAIYFPDPTWPNHHSIAGKIGIKIQSYRYYNSTTQNIDFEGLIEDLEKAPNGSVFLFHACAHNPTGTDLNEGQWKNILEVMKSKNHLPFLDMAYQGFASGDLFKDSFAVRVFANGGTNLLLSQSFSKNFGLYGQRVGCLSMICDNETETKNVRSNLKSFCRSDYSNPPKFGAYIVNTILQSKELSDSWLEELKGMSDRILEMRNQFVSKMKSVKSDKNWEHINRQIGMFAYTGMSQEQVKILKKKYHIYLPSSGRVNIAGLNSKNIDYVVNSFYEVTQNKL